MNDNDSANKPLASPELCRWLAEWSDTNADLWTYFLNDSGKTDFEETHFAHQILAACGRAMGDKGHPKLSYERGEWRIEAISYPEICSPDECIFSANRFDYSTELHAAIACAEAVRGEVGER